MDILWLGSSMLSSVSKHNIWSYYDSVYCCCRSLVNKICGCIIVGLVVVVVRQETTYFGFIVVVVRHQTQYMIVLWLGLSISSFGKHNMCSYYGWVCLRCHLFVNTICGRIIIGFIVVVRQ